LYEEDSKSFINPASFIIGYRGKVFLKIRSEVRKPRGSSEVMPFSHLESFLVLKILLHLPTV
jgi:hypothetical protein